MTFGLIDFILMVAHTDFDLKLHVDPSVIRVEERGDDGVKWISEEEASQIMHLIV